MDLKEIKKIMQKASDDYDRKQKQKVISHYNYTEWVVGIDEYSQGYTEHNKNNRRGRY